MPAVLSKPNEQSLQSYLDLVVSPFFHTFLLLVYLPHLHSIPCVQDPRFIKCSQELFHPMVRHPFRFVTMNLEDDHPISP